MKTRDKIMAYAQKGQLKASALSHSLGISRQTITQHLKKLVQEGKLLKTGSTKNAVYQISTRSNNAIKETKLLLVKSTKGLQEDIVFREIDARLKLRNRVSKNVHAILSYAFTEMLNNAIDHSQSKRVQIKLSIDASHSVFEVNDFGIGIFRNVQKKFKLFDEFVALEHVLKGKQTTAPDKHSGEGIFFTSRIADRFLLRSHKLQLTVDNQNPDISVAEKRFIKGTHVTFSVLNRSRKTLEKLFKEYTNEDYAFDKGGLRVKLSGYSGALSRSQARRLLIGMEKYRKISFDFTGVKEIGQAFADEIFRVFLIINPSIQVEYINANRAVEFMILRAKSSKA